MLDYYSYIRYYDCVLNNWLNFKMSTDNMYTSKVVKICQYEIEFDDGTRIYSDHERDCCENHYLDFSHLTLDDFEGLVFDLTCDSFFERVAGYGIRLVPLVGHPVSVPGYASNNGYYSSDLTLVVQFASRRKTKTYDITECQDY